MTWWLWLIVALALHLLASMTPWIALQIAAWRIQGRGPFLANQTLQFEQILAAEREHSERWPARPRAGRYRDVDSVAIEQLMRIRVIISQVNDLWPAVAGFTPPAPAPLRVLAMGAWRPLRDTLGVWRVKRRLNALLDEGRQAMYGLTHQWAEAQSIPGRIQAELADVRAEAQRLRAMWQTQVDEGALGLDSIGQGVASLDRSLGEGLDAMRQAEPEKLAAAALQCEGRLAKAVELARALERDLQRAIEVRRRALEGVERMDAGVRALQERWRGLEARGAREPAVAQRVRDLALVASELAGIAKSATTQAYEETLAGLDDYQALERSLSDQFEALEGLMRSSQEALVSSAATAAEAQRACDALREDGGLELDLCDALLVQTNEIRSQAKGQLALGTWYGYQTSLSLAEQARQKAKETADLSEATSMELAQVRTDRPLATPQVRDSLRERAHSADTALRYYARHWDDARQAEFERIYTMLTQADAAWELLPAALQRGEMPRQSELRAAAEALKQTTAATRRAHQLVEAQEGTLTRLNSQRRMLDEGLTEVDRDLLPTLEGVRDAMLPELLERYEAWSARYLARLPELKNAAQVNYDEVADRWLPETLAQARNILATHGEDVARYRRLAQEARKRIEREWQRLQKLDPMQRPLPEENLEQLTSDHEAWQAEIAAEIESPAALSELAGRRLAALERRIEAARRQITEGRQTLASLDRQYGQQLQSMQKSRAVMRALVQDSQWRQIEWDLADGEEQVERAAIYQEASREAESLDEAINQMRRAVNTAQEAQQIYHGVEQQLTSAQDRLNREFRAANADLDRAQRRAGQLRSQGQSDALRALEARCAAATSLIGMAQNAATFENALRHLREAQEELARG